VAAKNVKLLVLEGHLDMQKFMEDFCEVNGFEVDSAANGLEPST
jgi:DNA-binding response OmpR family regulator